MLTIERGENMGDPRNKDNDYYNDSELGGMGPADYDIQDEYGLMTGNTADQNLSSETDEWGF